MSDGSAAVILPPFVAVEPPPARIYKVGPTGWVAPGTDRAENISFHRTVAGAARWACDHSDCRVFDLAGRRLEPVGSTGLAVARAGDGVGATELHHILAGWVGYLDLVRWNPFSMSIKALFDLALDTTGYWEDSPDRT